MYASINSFIQKNVNKGHHISFEIYIGKQKKENTYSISLKKDDFVKKLENTNLNHSSFYKEKVFYKNNNIYIDKNKEKYNYLIKPIRNKWNKEHNLIMICNREIPQKYYNNSKYNHKVSHEVIEINYETINIYFIHSLKDQSNKENYYIKIKFKENTNITQLCQIISTLSK